MHFVQALLAFGATFSFAVAIHVPDGTYIVNSYQNGTQVYNPTNSDASLIVITKEDSLAMQANNRRSSLSSRALAKRRVDCWGYQLDASGTDRSFQGLAEGWAANGHEFCSQPNGPAAVAIIVEAVQVYYCITLPNRCGNLDREDVYHARDQMDGTCHRYEASWFGWPGSYEIVGKARVGDQICTGSF